MARSACPSNIMSLGGIAIAIGAMVDAAMVMIENAHKWLERWNHARAKRDNGRRRRASRREREVVDMSRTNVVVSAAQAGRQAAVLLAAHHHGLVRAGVRAAGAVGSAVQAAGLHEDLLDVLRCAAVRVTLVPILMVWFIRGKIR